MMVSGGYPGSYEKGKEILGLGEVTDSILFHAGTRIGNNRIVTNGGRVLAVTSYGQNMDEALERSYRSISRICFEQCTFRKDIGFDLR
jgi:phosphoribosylamine--glycine ligase